MGHLVSYAEYRRKRGLPIFYRRFVVSTEPALDVHDRLETLESARSKLEARYTDSLGQLPSDHGLRIRPRVRGCGSGYQHSLEIFSRIDRVQKIITGVRTHLANWGRSLIPEAFLLLLIDVALDHAALLLREAQEECILFDEWIVQTNTEMTKYHMAPDF